MRQDANEQMVEELTQARPIHDGEINPNAELRRN